MKKRLLFALTLILSTTFLALNAQNWDEIIKATAVDAAAGDNFGWSVAIDGDYAIIGALFGDGSGSAYIFERSGSNWIQQAKLTASDAEADDQFGRSVSINGDYAIVGAFNNDDTGSNSGSAYIFNRSGSNWTQQAKLTASDPASDDQFGVSVSIDGDYAIIGAIGNDDDGSDSGSAYVFLRSGTSWTEQAKLTASDAAATDLFGFSVSMDNDYVIIGANGDDDGGSFSGSAYIFNRSGSSWIEQAKLTASDAAVFDQFGSSVAINGDYAIIGVAGDDDAGSLSGSAYIFSRSGTNWIEQAKLTASDATASDRFGSQVDIDGISAIVGAPGNSDAGSSSGSAYIFERSGGNWIEQTKLTASDASSNDQFGASVAINSIDVVVGARFSDESGTNSGSAYFFENEEPPIVPDITDLPSLSAQCEITPTAPTANSGTITAIADVAFPVTTQGSTIVTWTYDDGIGNTLTQTQTININDTTGPNLSFANPSDALIESCPTEVIVPSPQAFDDCITNDFALDFDGVDDMVTVNQTIGSFKTIEFWMYTENGINGSEEFDYLFSFNDSNLKYIGTGNFSVSYTNETLSMVTNFGQILTTFEVIPPGWNHIAITGNGSSFDQIVINGDSKPVVNNGFPAVFEAATTYIGQNPAAGASRFEGKLDEVRFWDTPRTEQDIADNFEQLIDPTSPNLLAYYGFEDGTGSSVLSDMTSTGANGVLNNMDVNIDWIPSTAPVSSVTLTNDFNGTSDASGTYPEGQTTVTWTATDASGNQSTLEQIVDINCSITYTFNNGWSPSDPSGIATANDIIVIEVGNATITSNTTANIVNVDLSGGLTIDASATLTTTNGLNLTSSSNSYSSLILNGDVVGVINYDRFVNSNILGNDLISPPLAGQSWSSFLEPVNAEVLLDNGGNPITYAFAPFDKSTGDFENYNTNTVANLTSGVGYRVATDTGDRLRFSGTVASNVSVNIVDSTTDFSEWNLVGNPYPSYLNVQTFLNHQVESGVSNIDLFVDETAAIYGYDGDASNGWTIYNLANTNASTVMAPGQGFFVAADAANVAAYDLEFTPAMQSTGDSDDFIVGRNAELIYLKLGLSSNTNIYSTDVYFNANASQGLDKGYDAALWGTDAPEFSIYSHLVQDNVGKPMALQTLNATDLAEVSIPLGVHANQGEQITFSISESTLPSSVNVYLDDVVANTTTLLNTSDYIITPTTNLSGTGRFFLRTYEDALSTIDNNLDTLNVFALNSSKEIVVNGKLQEATTLELYDIQGRKILSTLLDTSVMENRIDVSSLSGGVYVVKIQNEIQQKSQKVIIK